LAALDAIGARALGDRLGDAVLGAERPVSGGEAQWIAVARALATELPVLLLDEPTSGLDTRSQTAMLDALAKLRGRRTVILVTHRPEPLGVADIVVRLQPEDLDRRAAADLEGVGANDLAVEHVGAARPEPERDTLREPVD